MSRILRILGCWMICLSLITIVTMGTSYGDNSVPTITIGKLAVGKSTLELIEPHLLQWNSSKAVVSFRIRLANTGNKVEEIMRYSVKIVTKEGVSISANLLDKESNTKVEPYSTAEYSFYANVSANTQLSELKFVFTEWNVAYANFSKEVGVLRVPASYQESVTEGHSKSTRFHQELVNLLPQSFYISEQSGSITCTLNLTVQNWGNSPLEFPEYTYFLQSESGSMFQMEQPSADSITLTSKGIRSIPLYAQLPKNSADQRFTLILMRKTGEEKNASYAVQYKFDLPEVMSWNTLPSAEGTGASVRFGERKLEFAVIDDLTVSSGEEENVLAIKVAVTNRSNAASVLPKLASYFEINGKRYEAEVSIKDSKNKLMPNDKLIAEIVAKVPTQTTARLTRVVLLETLANEATPVNRPLVAFDIGLGQSDYSSKDALSLSSSKHLIRNGQPIVVSIDTISELLKGKERTISGRIHIRNNGIKPMKLPAYRVGVAVKGMATYYGTVPQDSSHDVQPESTAVVNFEVKIPVNLGLEEALIRLEEASFSSNADVFSSVAVFRIAGSNDLRAKQEEWFTISTSNGDYKARVKATYRLPIEDKDIIVSDIELQGVGLHALPVPSLSGSYNLNQRTEIKADVVVMDNVISTSDQPLSYQVVGEIPYSSDIRKLSLRLQEEGDHSTGGGNTIDVSRISEVPSYTADQKYMTIATGHASEVTIQQVHTYIGAVDDRIEVQIIQQNKERRNPILNRLTGYLATPDMEYYPLELVPVISKVGYNGKVVLTGSVNVPKGTQTSALKLILGQAVTGSELTSSDGSTDAYVAPALYALPAELIRTETTLKHIAISPYTLSVHAIQYKSDSEISGSYVMEMELQKVVEFDVDQSKPQLIVELTNDSESSISQTYNLNTGDASGQTIRLGKGEYAIRALDMQRFNKVNVYLASGEYRKLVASSKL